MKTTEADWAFIKARAIESLQEPVWNGYTEAEMRALDRWEIQNQVGLAVMSAEQDRVLEYISQHTGDGWPCPRFSKTRGRRIAAEICRDIRAGHIVLGEKQGAVP